MSQIPEKQVLDDGKCRSKPVPILISFPGDVMQRIASFLPPRDALNLSYSCKGLHTCLSLSKLPPRIIFKKMQLSGHVIHGDTCYEAGMIPILHPRPHTVRIACRWRDQGFGNRKGECWIVGRRSSHARDVEELFDGGRIVYESPSAPHNESLLSVEFCPLEEEIYHIWYKVGSGGGHTLLLRKCIIEELVYDDSDQNFASNCFRLKACRVLMEGPPAPDFLFQILLATCKSARMALKNGQEPDEAIKAVFQKYNFPITAQSLLSLEEIVHRESELIIQIHMDNTERERARRQESAERQSRAPQSSQQPHVLLQPQPPRRPQPPLHRIILRRMRFPGGP
jgi:hypothetical protein